MADTNVAALAPRLEHKRKFGEVGTADDVKRLRIDVKARLSQAIDPKTDRLFEQEKQIKDQQRRIAELESTVEEQETVIALASKMTPPLTGEDVTRDASAQSSQIQVELEEARARIKALGEQVYQLAISPPDEAASIALEAQAQQHLNLVHALQGQVAGRDAYIERLESGKIRDAEYIQHLQAEVARSRAGNGRHEYGHTDAAKNHVAVKAEDPSVVLKNAPSQVANKAASAHKRASGLATENACLKRGLLKRDAIILELKQRLLAKGVNIDNASLEDLQRQLDDVIARSLPPNLTDSGDVTMLTPKQEAHVRRRISNEVRGQREAYKKKVKAEAKAEARAEVRIETERLRVALKEAKKKVGDVALCISTEVKGAREATEKAIANRLLREVPQAHSLSFKPDDSPAALSPTQQQLVQHLIDVSVKAAKLRADAAEAAVDDLKACAHESEAFMKVLTAGNEGLLQALADAKAASAVEDKLAAVESHPVQHE